MAEERDENVNNTGTSGSAAWISSLTDMFIRNVREYNGVSVSDNSTPDVMAAIENMEVKEDDIFLATYPRSGKYKQN